VDTLFVVVVVVLVFVEREFAIRATIDAQLNRIGGLFGRPLGVGSQGNDRSGANIKRQPIERSIRGNLARVMGWCSAPEVVPLCIGTCICIGKIDAAAGGCWLRYRIHQERWAVHKFVPCVLGAHIAAEIHYQRTHGSIAVVRRLPGQRIGVRQQAIAQAIEVDENLLRVRSVRPEFVFVGGRACRAPAKLDLNVPNWNQRMNSSRKAGSVDCRRRSRRCRWSSKEFRRERSSVRRESGDGS